MTTGIQYWIKIFNETIFASKQNHTLKMQLFLQLADNATICRKKRENIGSETANIQH